MTVRDLKKAIDAALAYDATLIDLPVRVGEWQGEAIVSGPTRVEVERRSESGMTMLVTRHNGYVDRYGIIHERHLALSSAGDRLDGMDSFRTTSGKPISRSGRDAFAIRFHLHPSVRTTRGDGSRAVLLELPDGERWQFLTEGHEIEIEESILFSNTRGSRKAEQLVIHGRCQQTSDVTWQMQRLAVGGRRQRALPAAESPARLPLRT